MLQRGRPRPEFPLRNSDLPMTGESAIVSGCGGDPMARNNRLRDAAVKIGSAVGKAEGKAHRAAQKAAKAAQVAKDELAELSKQVAVLKKQLEKSTDRLKKALR
jgi:hypothetical protein